MISTRVVCTISVDVNLLVELLLGINWWHGAVLLGESMTCSFLLAVLEYENRQMDVTEGERAASM
jgi:hypothetical protein